MISKTAILKARKAYLPEYLTANGHVLKREGSQFRVVGVPGLTVVDCRWYNHAQQQGGNALDYAVQVEGRPFAEAVAALECFSRDAACCDEYLPAAERRMAFKRPPGNGDNRRVETYLVKTRGINYDVLKPHLASGRIYESLFRHNCVFIGTDCDTGEARYAFERSSIPGSRIMFESQGSDKRCSFGIHGMTDTILVFESAIDMLSYSSMEPGDQRRNDSMLSLGGLSGTALDHFARKHRGLKNIVFCIDSDRPADDAYMRLGQTYMSRGYNVSRHSPEFKDWNEQLLRGGHSFPAPHVRWGGVR
jgi:hypothetical protein